MLAPTEHGTPLARGPIYGILYCLVGIGDGWLAGSVGGRTARFLRLAAALLFGAGLWTASFTGGLLALLRYAERKAATRSDADQP